MAILRLSLDRKRIALSLIAKHNFSLVCSYSVVDSEALLQLPLLSRVQDSARPYLETAVPSHGSGLLAAATAAAAPVGILPSSTSVGVPCGAGVVRKPQGNIENGGRYRPPLARRLPMLHHPAPNDLTSPLNDALGGSLPLVVCFFLCWLVASDG